MTIRFAVVGSGRSGTKYASELFTRLGIPCGHEALFGSAGPLPPDLVGDASFGLVPYLDRFTGLVFHQVRHPLAVLRSIVATGFFESPGQYASYLDLIEGALPGISRKADPLQKATYYIAEWNRMCEPFACLRWRVEDLDPETLERAADLVGHPRSLEACALALEGVPRDVNRLEGRGLARLEFGWETIPDGPEKRALVEMAARYGYAL